MNSEKGKSEMKDKYDSFLYFERLFYNLMRNRCIPQLRRLGRKLSPILGRFFLIIGIGGDAMSPHMLKMRALKKKASQFEDKLKVIK